MKRKEKLSRRQKRAKRRSIFKTLFLLSVTLIFNTYAWFLYTTTVSSNLTAHVDAWHVVFKIDDKTVEKEFKIQIDHAYPGMKDEIKKITMVNDGDREAGIGYVVKSVRIFDEQFVATDQLSSGESAPTGATGLTADELLDKIENDYPFHVTFTTSADKILTGESQDLNINFAWAYESGDDEKDTNYGTTSYEYSQVNSGKAAIEMSIKLIVAQDETS